MINDDFHMGFLVNSMASLKNIVFIYRKQLRNEIDKKKIFYYFFDELFSIQI